MVPLNDHWIDYLRNQPETGMDYQIAKVELADGGSFESVVFVGGMIAEVDRSSTIPFSAADITSIKVQSGLE